jgi:ABC-2 type transport system permease protein
MKWYHVFIKSLREQIRDYWILLLVVLLAPFFIFIYYLMIEAESMNFDILLVNNDRGGIFIMGTPMNLGDSLVHYCTEQAGNYEDVSLRFHREQNRESAIATLREKKADVLLVIPGDFTAAILSNPATLDEPAHFELVGNITDMQYIIGAIWTQELFTRFLIGSSGYEMPISWTETELGHSGDRSEFELYVPGMLILAIIMMMFSATAAIVREPEMQTLKRLKISKLPAISFLTGVSLVQIIVSAISLLLALLTAMALGYELIPGTTGYLILIAFLTSVSVIAFSLLFAAFCRSIRDVAIIGTFPLLVFMFFTGAALPLSGGTLFTLGGFEFTLNGILAPSHAITALNKVMLLGQTPGETMPEILALLIVTVIYFILGVWAFSRRHMRAE